jgi:succinyl-CoA synthetase beta subunit
MNGGIDNIDATPIETARAEDRTTLTEAESKRVLASVGIETPAHEVVETPDEAVAAAEAVGFPVVLKVSSPAVRHKSEWADGAGVALGLDSAEAVRAAAEGVRRAADTEAIEASILVERGVDTEGGTEVIVGGLRDESFGPTVLVGLGGVFTEVFEDTSHRLAPIDTDEARTAIGELRSATLLRGYRDRPAADLDALAATVRAVGDLVANHEQLAEVDLNPVLASPDGAVALDGLVTLREDG